MPGCSWAYGSGRAVSPARCSPEASSRWPRSTSSRTHPGRRLGSPRRAGSRRPADPRQPDDAVIRRPPQNHGGQCSGAGRSSSAQPSPGRSRALSFRPTLRTAETAHPVGNLQLDGTNAARVRPHPHARSSIGGRRIHQGVRGARSRIPARWPRCHRSRGRRAHVPPKAASAISNLAAPQFA
jgi:hypothetical protein